MQQVKRYIYIIFKYIYICIDVNYTTEHTSRFCNLELGASTRLSDVNSIRSFKVAQPVIANLSSNVGV